MSHDFVNDVDMFHEKFGLEYRGEPRALDNAELDFRLKFLREELDEVIEAAVLGDLAQLGGELADLVWVAIGFALRSGIDLRDHWEEIRRANMAKVRATDASQSKRGNTIDIVKPEGWQRPNHGEVLKRARQRALQAG